MPHDPEAWMQRANCTGTDPEIFFGESGCNGDDAKRICGRCDVASECLAYAVERPHLSGVWGGVGHRARQQMKKRGAN